MANEPLDKNKEKSGIEKLPENFRRKILWTTITILMLIIFSIWITNLPKSLQPTQKEKERDKASEQIGKDLTIFLTDAQKQFAELKDDFKELGQILQNPAPATTTTPEQVEQHPQLNQDDLNKIKERINNISSSTDAQN